MTASSLLPPYSIRFSTRARRINLRVRPGKGLEVVLPAHADPSCVPEVLARHRHWIETRLARMPDAKDRACPLPPASIPIKGGREELRLCFASPGDSDSPPAPRQDARLSGSAPHSPLTPAPPLVRELVLRDGNQEEIPRRLRLWVREEARIWLGGMLEEVAREHDFSFASLSVRFQKSRWGSCSAKGRISLNACLLFLPERLVRYILLHELCHTRQMNHSPAFWKLVFAADPDALAKDKAMRGAWKYVPAWIQT